MKRPLVSAALLLAALPVVVALLASRPAPFGPGGVVEAHRALFASLDRGDEAAAAKFFTRSHIGMGLDASGKFGASPGSLYYVPGGGADPAHALCERFAGGKTLIVSGWSECASGEQSWAALEIEHTPADGPTQRWQSTSLVRHAEDGFRLYLWHLSPASAAPSAAR